MIAPRSDLVKFVISCRYIIKHNGNNGDLGFVTAKIVIKSLHRNIFNAEVRSKGVLMPLEARSNKSRTSL